MMWRKIGLAILMAAGGMRAAAMFVAPEVMPAERVLRNIDAQVKAHPEDDEALYTRARVNYLCFANKLSVVEAFTTNTVRRHMRVAPEHLREAPHEVALEGEVARRMGNTPRNLDRQGLKLSIEKSGWKPPTMGAQEAAKYAEAAWEDFDKVIRMRPTKPLYVLGRASLGSQWLDYTSTTLNVSEITSSPMLRTITPRGVGEDFYRAFALAIKQDLKDREQDLIGLRGWLSYESGQGYLEIMKQVAAPTIDDLKRIKEVKQSLARLEKKPRSKVVTPIIFSVEGRIVLKALLQPQARVAFDLDGSGRPAQWEWVRPTTGILVWDPEGRGQIRSGRQLFGSATWWMLFADGYRALDALDDNRDGGLSGKELRGIGVWTDRNGDGVSQPGEVVPVETFGIERIEVKATTRQAGCLANAAGITLRGGRKLATFDWIAKADDGGR